MVVQMEPLARITTRKVVVGVMRREALLSSALSSVVAYLLTAAVDIQDYQEELMVSLTSARELAAEAIRRAQGRYKFQYDKNVREKTLRKGDWVLVHFSRDETGCWRKLSRPWHGPYRIVQVTGTGVMCTKVYYPQEGELHVHQSRVCLCPHEFPLGFYWYGGRCRGPGRPPKWVDRLLQSGSAR